MAGRPRWAGAIPRPVLALTTLVLAGQVVAWAHRPSSKIVLGLSLLILQVLGVACSWRAARRGPARVTWVLATVSCALLLTSTLTFLVDAVAQDGPWWWLAVACGLLSFLGLTLTVLSTTALRLNGGQRWAFLAETGTVLSSGFMIIWYFVLEPATQGPATIHWVFQLGFPLGNLVLLSAVCAVLLRGAVATLTPPTLVLAGGILAYAVADIAYSAAQIRGARTTTNMTASTALVLACLLIAVAAMLQTAARATTTGDGAPAGVIRMPDWSAHLPYVAVGLGNVLLLVVTVREGQFSLWGGLTLGQIGMTVALAVRQIVFLRDSRRLNVTDALTGLANITGLRQALDRMDTGDGHAMLLIDLDEFKEINDGYGHAAGDRVLVEFARLLRAAVRRGDLAARVGGDEFVVLLAGVSGDAQAVPVAERILAALAANPVPAGQDLLTIRASIGLAAAAAGEPAQELQRRADLAMYESKRSGKHGWTAYHPAMTDRRTRDRVIGEAILPGLAGAQFEVLYQPMRYLPTGDTVAVEALLRWRHPVLGPVSPVEFIPIAERTGAIGAIGMWVLEQACAQVQRWREAGADLYVSVNVSAPQLAVPTFVDDVRAVLARTGLPAGRLYLEITESAIVDEEIAIPTLEALRRHGVGVSVDDFGTGYSSLHYLTRLPVDTLKIDRSFVAQLDTTPQGAGVTEAIIRLAQVLGLTVVAEGIETAAQAAELQMLGCEMGQGYLFARPMTAAQYETAHAIGAAR